MLHRTLIAIVSISVLTQLCTAEKPKTDKDRIQGEWRVTSMRVRGTDINIADLGDGGYTFTDDRLTVVADQQKTISEITFHTDHKPKRLTMKAIEGVGAGKAVYAIYRFKDNKLTLCIGDARPTTFSGDGEAGLLVLERTKSTE